MNQIKHYINKEGKEEYTLPIEQSLLQNSNAYTTINGAVYHLSDTLWTTILKGTIVIETIPDPELTEDEKKIKELTEQINAKLLEIKDLKEQLSATDYKAIKYAEGWISEEDYAQTKAERQALRLNINAKELEITELLKLLNELCPDNPEMPE